MEKWCNEIFKQEHIDWMMELEMRRPDLSRLEDPRVLNSEFMSLLDKTDWYIIRHLDQKASNVETSLTEEQFSTLQQNRQIWRDKIV